MKKIIILLLLSSTMVFSQTTPNLGFNIPSPGALNWNVSINNNFSSLDSYLSGGTAIPALIITGNLTVGGTCSGCGGAGGGVSLGNDLGGSDSSPEVIGILSHALPSLAVGYLFYSGSAWGFTGGSSISGSGTAGQVGVWSNSSNISGYVGFTSDSSGNIAVNSVTSTTFGQFGSVSTVGSNAGMITMQQGPDNSSNCATSQICDEAPTSVTKYTEVRSGTGPSVQSIKLYSTLSGNKTVESFIQWPPVTLGQAATGDYIGHCTMVASTTCTGTLGSTYAVYRCFPAIDHNSAPPSPAIVSVCSISGTTFTITAGASNSLIWDAFYVGDPS